MSVKSILKRWIESVDEALLKEIQAHKTAETLSLPFEAPLVPSSSFTTVSPLSTLVAPGNTATTPLECHADIDSMVAPKYVQINVPHRIESELLEPFEKGLKEVSLIFVHNRHIIQGTIESIHDTHLVMRTQRSTYFRRRGEVVLILIPVLPEKRYVIQLTVEEIYANRLMLRYQDPRYEVRRHIQLAMPVLLRLSPPILLTAIRQRRAYIIRKITLPPMDALATTPGRLTDQLCELDGATPSPLARLIEQASPLSCRLQDLSLGGLSLALADASQAKELLYRLVFLQISLPLVTVNSVKREYMPVHLDLLGAIRGVETMARPATLHIRFLQRLPGELALYLADLERRCIELQRPLA